MNNQITKDQVMFYQKEIKFYGADTCEQLFRKTIAWMHTVPFNFCSSHQLKIKCIINVKRL